MNKSHGIFYGVNVNTHKPIICNRRDLQYPNCFIFGHSGSGKTEVAKREIKQIIDNTEDEVIIFCEAGEYAKTQIYPNTICLDSIAQIKLSSQNEGYHINPMDFVLNEYDPFGYDIQHKCDTITAIFEIVMKRPLSQSETSAVHNAVKAVLTPFVQELKRQNRNYAPEINPTFEDVMKALAEDRNGENVTNFYNLFCSAKESCAMLKYRTNMPHHKAIEIAWYTMPCKLDLIMYVVCMDYARNRLLLNEKRKTIYMYWDNADCVLNNKIDCSKMFLSLLRESRKCGSTQTLLASEFFDVLPTATDLFPQFELFEFLSQSEKSRTAIQTLYNFDEQAMSYITSSPCGTGLFYKTDGTPVPFVSVVK